jgi:putative FmdB family regulatory protein
VPIYAYKCSSCGHAEDTLQKLSAAPLTTCPACHQETYVKQVTAAGFQLKGSGWYVTDFRNNGGGAGAAASGASATKDAKSGDSATGGQAADASGASAAGSSSAASTNAATTPAKTTATPTAAPTASTATKPSTST